MHHSWQESWWLSQVGQGPSFLISESTEQRHIYAIQPLVRFSWKDYSDTILLTTINTYHTEDESGGDGQSPWSWKWRRKPSLKFIKLQHGGNCSKTSLQLGRFKTNEQKSQNEWLKSSIVIFLEVIKPRELATQEVNMTRHDKDTTKCNL